ncbi:MAG: cytochrome c3 family protein [Desulfovibrio sp.]
MNKHLLAILGVTGALFLASAVGYILPAPADGPPARVILDNTGGRVVFAHLVHAQDYGLDCADCHHDEGDPERPVPCGACHPAAFDASWAAEHPKSFADKKMCLRCHDKDPSGGVAPEDKPDASWIPVRTEAFHSQCMGCHESMSGPAGDGSCKSCHAGI